MDGLLSDHRQTHVDLLVRAYCYIVAGDHGPHRSCFRVCRRICCPFTYCTRLLAWPWLHRRCAWRTGHSLFLFFVIALDQVIEATRHHVLCPDWVEPIRQGSDFVVCQAAKMPLGNAPQWVHESYGFAVAVFTFAIVFGAFAANVIQGAMGAVPRGQIETGESYGMTSRQTFWRILVPQMWIYALPGLSNLWMILIKATPLLFLLGIQDIVYWARELGGIKTSRFTDYPHGDWRMWYFLALLVFYLIFTRFSEITLERLMTRLTRGQATTAGEAQRKADTT